MSETPANSMGNPTPMPFSINFRAGPGDEPTLVKAAPAYEVVTRHHVPPAAFGALKWQAGSDKNTDAGEQTE